MEAGGSVYDDRGVISVSQVRSRPLGGDIRSEGYSDRRQLGWGTGSRLVDGVAARMS